MPDLYIASSPAFQDPLRDQHRYRKATNNLGHRKVLSWLWPRGGISPDPKRASFFHRFSFSSPPDFRVNLQWEIDSLSRPIVKSFRFLPSSRPYTIYPIKIHAAFDLAGRMLNYHFIIKEVRGKKCRSYRIFPVSTGKNTMQ
jgi:hypothetical protein